MTASPSTPYTLLVLDGEGKPVAAWEDQAPGPLGAVLQIAERATSASLRDQERNPARWQVTDQAGDPGAFWPAVLRGEIGVPPPALFVPPPRPAADTGQPVRGPVPPAGFPVEDRHRWVCRWALSKQAALMVHPGLRFHGTPEHVGCAVSVCTASGGYLFQLANTGYRHSPAGFGAGYAGSGAAALARSLLTAALARYAACPACRGAGRTTWDDHGEVPVSPDDPGAARCFACTGDGVGIQPAVYQRFKDEIITRLPGDAEWWMTRDEVLGWLTAQAYDPALAAAAEAVAR